MSSEDIILRLIEFVSETGRLPKTDEPGLGDLINSAIRHFGSLENALKIAGLFLSEKYTIKPVKELPKIRRVTVYDELVGDFLKSGEKYAEVSVEDKKPDTVLSILRRKAKGKGIVVSSIGGKVYLKRQ